MKFSLFENPLISLWNHFCGGKFLFWKQSQREAQKILFRKNNIWLRNSRKINQNFFKNGFPLPKWSKIGFELQKKALNPITVFLGVFVEKNSLKKFLPFFSCLFLFKENSKNYFVRKKIFRKPQTKHLQPNNNHISDIFKAHKERRIVQIKIEASSNSHSH